MLPGPRPGDHPNTSAMQPFENIAVREDLKSDRKFADVPKARTEMTAVQQKNYTDVMQRIAQYLIASKLRNIMEYF